VELELVEDAGGERELRGSGFGRGRRLFEGLAPEQIELERIRILEGRPASPTCTTGCSLP
jgi:hypothetical protein